MLWTPTMCHRHARVPARITRFRLGILVWLSLLGGCQHHIYSPPGRVMPLQSVAPLPAGDTALTLEGGPHGAVFGPELLSGALRARHGLGHEVDGIVEASVLHVQGRKPDVRTHPNAYAVYTGAKWAFWRHLALEGGLAGGGSQAGGFLSPNLGWIAAYENPYLVPFLQHRIFVSQPLARRAVDIGDRDVDDEGPGQPILHSPLRTVGTAAVLGLRFPMGPMDAEIGSLLVGLGGTYVHDGTANQVYMGFQAGFELRL
jgi:hypothetical protein